MHTKRLNFFCLFVVEFVCSRLHCYSKYSTCSSFRYRIDSSLHFSLQLLLCVWLQKRVNYKDITIVYTIKLQQVLPFTYLNFHWGWTLLHWICTHFTRTNVLFWFQKNKIERKRSCTEPFKWKETLSHVGHHRQLVSWFMNNNLAIIIILCILKRGTYIVLILWNRSLTLKHAKAVLISTWSCKI